MRSSSQPSGGQPDVRSHAKQTLRHVVLDSNLWLASCATSLAAYGMLSFGGRCHVPAVLWVFFFVLAYYNIHGLIRLKRGDLFDLNCRHYYQSTASKIFCSISMVGTFMLVLLAPEWMWPILWMLCLASCAYDLPLFKMLWRRLGGAPYGRRSRLRRQRVPSPQSLGKPTGKGLAMGGRELETSARDQEKAIQGQSDGLRALPFVKAFLVASVITCLVGVLPVLWQRGVELGFEAQSAEFDGLKDGRLWVLWFHLYLNTTMGDLRDHRSDRRHGMQTWAVLLGFEACRRLMLVLACLVCGGLVYFGAALEWQMLFAAHVMVLFMVKASWGPSRYHWVDLLHWLPLLGYVIRQQAELLSFL